MFFFFNPTKDHEALVDVVGLLQGLPLAPRLLGHLTARQVHKVDLPVSCDVDTLDHRIFTDQRKTGEMSPS